MSGTSWREKARAIVKLDAWPTDIDPVDRKAVEDLANGLGYEPYYALKGVIHGIEQGAYTPSRFALTTRDKDKSGSE